jgi:hypothetical protein
MTSFPNSEMANAIVKSLSSIHSATWALIARGGYFAHTAENKAAIEARFRILADKIEAVKGMSIDTKAEYLRKAKVVGRKWKPEFTVHIPQNDLGQFTDEAGNVLSFVAMLEYGAVAPEDIGQYDQGSVIQKLQAYWVRVNDISDRGPKAERPEPKPKAKAEPVVKVEQVPAEVVESEPSEEPVYVLSEAFVQGLDESDFTALVALVKAEQMRRHIDDAKDQLAA